MADDFDKNASKFSTYVSAASSLATVAGWARIAITSLSLSAVGFFGIVKEEQYTEAAIIPVAGDVPTIGFGTTNGVKLGDKTTPVRAVGRAIEDIGKYEGAVKGCVNVPLSQIEYDVYISLSYNIGPGAFCGSTLVKKLNNYDYAGACYEILKWDKFKGKPLRGLTLRREREFNKCISA